jgi:hypothetical protein
VLERMWTELPPTGAETWIVLGWSQSCGDDRRDDPPPPLA